MPSSVSVPFLSETTNLWDRKKLEKAEQSPLWLASQFSPPADESESTAGEGTVQAASAGQNGAAADHFEERGILSSSEDEETPPEIIKSNNDVQTTRRGRQIKRPSRLGY